MVVSQRKFAELAGVTPKAIRKAREAGRVVELTGKTELDTAHPINAAFIERHLRDGVPPARGTGPRVGHRAVGDNGAHPNNSSTLAGLSATLHGRLYDLALWDANVVSAARVRAELHDDADYWLCRAQSLPAEIGCHIALLMGVSPVQQVAELDQAMADYLRRVGDQHARVDAVIEKVQQQWIDYPIRRVARPPQIPEFSPPATEAEARARLAMARGDLVEVRMRFRAGETVAAAATKFAGNDLRVKWTMMLADEFPIGCAAELFPQGHNLPWAFAQMCNSVVIGRLSSYWALDLAPGSFANAVAPFAAERWRRHGGYPTKDEVPALRAADQLRVEEAVKIRRERL